jgi:hypothetical protein
MMIKKLRTQSILEYVALVLIVSVAVSTMTFYLQRALRVRQRHLAQELNEANR